MSELNYLELENILNKELQAYEQLSDLLDTKKDSLVKNDIERLQKVDLEIEKHNLILKNIEKERLLLTDNKKFSLGQIIEHVPAKKETFTNLQKKFKKIGSKIQLKNDLNKKLVEHSLAIIEGSIHLISKAFIPETAAYNQKGSSNKKDYNRLSSIVKEA